MVGQIKIGVLEAKTAAVVGCQNFREHFGDGIPCTELLQQYHSFAPLDVARPWIMDLFRGIRMSKLCCCGYIVGYHPVQRCEPLLHDRSMQKSFRL